MSLDGVQGRTEAQCSIQQVQSVFFPHAVGIELDKFIRTETEELDKSVICFS